MSRGGLGPPVLNTTVGIRMRVAGDPRPTRLAARAGPCRRALKQIAAPFTTPLGPAVAPVQRVGTRGGGGLLTPPSSGNDSHSTALVV